MKKLVSLLLVVAMSFSLMACGADTLESVFNNSAVKKQMQQEIDSVKGMFDGVYSDISINVEGNNIIYKYVFDESFDTSLVQVDEAGLKNAVDSIKDGIEKELKIRPETVKYIYYDANGNVVSEVSK